MNKLINIAIIILVYSTAFGQARPGAYLWAVKLMVVDENGTPVTNANTVIAYSPSRPVQLSQPLHSTDAIIVGFTDTSGLFMASHTDWSTAVAIHVKSDGYYPTYLYHELYMPGQFDDQKVAASRSYDQKIVLKKIATLLQCMRSELLINPPKITRRWAMIVWRVIGLWLLVRA